MKRISWFAIKAKGKEHEQNKIILGVGKKSPIKLFGEGRLKFSKGCENQSEISNTVNNNEGERTDSAVCLYCLQFLNVLHERHEKGQVWKSKLIREIRGN